ncbi:MAG: chromosomal replication initiator protein DnaA [Deltaproteobacteria bacterium]|nr:chromosomal replication initiator protein DnaA [Deltaproteobacteria bacterium]
MDLDWQSAVNSLKGRIADPSFGQLITRVNCRRITESSVVIEVPNKFERDFIADRFLPAIEAELRTQTGIGIDVLFEVNDGPPRDVARRVVSAESISAPWGPPETPKKETAGSPNGAAPRAEPTPFNGKRLNPKLSFENFVVGPSNQFAHAAAFAVADLPGHNYNPLFIYGGVGLGKTHLLSAIGNHIRSRNPDARIFYLSSEEFMNDLINSLRFDKMDTFRAKYRSSCDVLLIDDIQFIAGKDRTQEEFFHTFNSLYETHRQIVVTSDKVPNEIQGLEERLSSRFQWGLVADIKPPELETRIAILKKKSEVEGFFLPNDVALFLATHVSSNVRELEGSLIRLQAFASLTRREMSLDMGREVLSDLFQNRGEKVSVETIQKIVSNYYNVRVADMKSERRTKSIAFPRMIAMHLARKHTGCSFPEIGQRFGNRDHSTVMFACKKIQRMLMGDSALRSTVESIEKSLS